MTTNDSGLAWGIVATRVPKTQAATRHHLRLGDDAKRLRSG